MRKIFLIIILMMIFPQTILASEVMSEEFEYDIHRARVVSVENVQKVENGISTTTQNIEAKIISGDKKGEEVELINVLTGNDVYDIRLNERDVISLNYDGEQFHFLGYDNIRALTFLIITFIALLVIIGGIKGVKSLIALIITLTLILTILIPMLLRGYNPIWVSILVCTLSTLITFLIISGKNKKTLTAVLGTVTGLFFAGIIAYIFGAMSNVTGFSSNDATMLLYLPNQIEFNFKGLLFAGIIIGALGAAMDVSISIASALTEIISQNKSTTPKQIIKSGFNIGKDIMGTMINTLVLAYTGGALTTLIVFVGLNTSFYHIINLDFVATEVIRAIAGSIGLLVAIPATIFYFVLFEYGKERLNEKNN